MKRAEFLRYVLQRISDELPAAFPKWDSGIKRTFRRGRPTERYRIERNLQQALVNYFAGLQKRIVRNVIKP